MKRSDYDNSDILQYLGEVRDINAQIIITKIEIEDRQQRLDSKEERFDMLIKRKGKLLIKVKKLRGGPK